MSQTIPFGPPAHIKDADAILTTCTYPLTISVGDTLASAIFSRGLIRRIYCNSAGTLYLRRVGDDPSVMTAYTVAAGQYLDGQFVAIGGSTTGSTTGLSLVLEY